MSSRNKYISTIIIMLAMIATVVVFSPIAKAGDINDNAGTSAFSFLKINIGARAVAMGGAFTGLADDESALYYNPAGIARLEDNRFIAGYNNLYFDMQSGFLGIIRKRGFDRSIALYVSYLNLGNLVQTDQMGNITGDFGASDIVIGATYALVHKETIAFGVSGKIIYESVQNFSSTGLALDLGAHYHKFRSRFQAGFMVQNLGLQLSSLGDDKSSLPVTFRLGSAYQLKRIPIQFTADIILPTDNDLDFAFGAEYFESKPVYLRLGWNTFGSNFQTAGSSRAAGGLSAGFGIDVKEHLNFAYSITAGSDLGDSHRITLTGGL